MKNLLIKANVFAGELKGSCIKALEPKRGEGFLDVLIKILITVIIGAALLALLRVAIPDLFQDILDKIRSIFTI